MFVCVCVLLHTKNSLHNSASNAIIFHISYCRTLRLQGMYFLQFCRGYSKEVKDKE